MNESEPMVYQFLPELFLRAPYYSFAGYDLSRLPEVLQEQAFRNAVFLASMEFYTVLGKKGFDFDRLSDKERHTLYKYYNRMCFRPTPFGSFSSFTLLEWGSGSQVRLAGSSESVLHLLPDQGLLSQLKKKAGAGLSDRLIVNPALYRFNDVFRYTKSLPDDNGRFSFALEGIAAARFNVQLFSFLCSGRVSRGAVCDWIKQHAECAIGEAEEYIQFLLDAGAVFDAAQGSVIGDEVLKNMPGFPAWNDFWEQHGRFSVSEALSLSALAGKISSLPGDHAHFTGQRFYAALERSKIAGGRDCTEQGELLKAVRILQLLSNSERPADLSRFIRDFRSRFDQAKVPLLLALDPDGGLHYGDMDPVMPEPDILETISFPEPEDPDSTFGWRAVQQLVFRMWVGDNLRDPWAPLRISEADVTELEKQHKAVLPLPQTQALMYRSTGEHLILESSGGVSATSLIGRFSCFSDPVHDFCKALADRESAANPGVLFADIAQLSDLHVDNINRRRPIYPYEIPLNVFPAQQDEKLIFPGDLLLSLQGEELILESAKLKKRVIPRLATAYNFRNNHSPVFRLLCDLQYQGIQAGLSFSLESFFPGLAFYPRVCYGKVILCLAKWNFKEADFAPLFSVDEPDRRGALDRFRSRHHLPRYIALGATDQQLVFDLANITEANFFLECIRGLKRITVQEYLWPDRSVLSGRKPVAAQMVAFLAHDQQVFKTAKADGLLAGGDTQRDFLMGSDWLYLKIFCIPRASDEILVKIVFPFVKRHAKRIKNWFFIRYHDHGYHLRLRIQADEADLGGLLVALRKKIESSGHDKLIRDFQGDTYRREIERYGADLIPQVERLFGAGSRFAVLMLKLRENKSLPFSEFDVAVFTANGMIGCFFPDPAEALDYSSKVRDRFMAEFRSDKPLRVSMDEQYRKKKSAIADLVGNEDLAKHLSPVLKQMDVLNTLTGKYTFEKKMQLLADLVHMQMNRTFSVKQRQQELLVYYCLQKYLRSSLVREKSVN